MNKDLIEMSAFYPGEWGTQNIQLDYRDDNLYRRPFGFGRPFGGFGIGFPFLGGFTGGLLAGALLSPYGFGGFGYPYYPYYSPYYYPYYF